MSAGTDFYGINRILMKHAGLPAALPLPVAVQHGWQAAASPFEASSNPPEIWVWSPRIKEQAAKFYPAHQIRVVGSFFCYVYDEIAYQLPECKKEGSIIFPAHSSHFTKAKFSVEALAESLASLDDAFRPLTVCLYYLDMNEATIQAYQKHGINVVTNGSLFDSKFLHRFVENCFGKKYCIYNHLGSAVFYSTYMGLTPVRIGMDVDYENHDSLIEDAQFEEHKSKTRELTAALSDRMIREELGVDYMLSDHEMRQLILSLYKPFGIGRFLKQLVKKNVYVPFLATRR